MTCFGLPIAFALMRESARGLRQILARKSVASMPCAAGRFSLALHPSLIEARRIAANLGQLPELLRGGSSRLDAELGCLRLRLGKRRFSNSPRQQCLLQF
jgi:hypothetical protein